jgi:uncharacterized protein
MSAPNCLRIAGYAALFEAQDRGGDIIARGAFTETLARNRRIPLLWQHDPDHPIGMVELAAEDARGLRVIAQINAEEPARLLRTKAVTGLSFGYRVRVAQGQRPRRLLSLELIEVSLVTHPMQPAARVHLMA